MYAGIVVTGRRRGDPFAAVSSSRRPSRDDRAADRAVAVKQTCVRDDRRPLMHVSQLEWFVILGVTMAVLLFDVVFSARRLREPTKRECAIYVGLAVLFRPLGLVLPTAGSTGWNSSRAGSRSRSTAVSTLTSPGSPPCSAWRSSW